ncbi:DUF2752 domain-containing protein [Kitasatospora sp. A2-31]|uniref:DUF2752 domain-containing protein n=1 Tax=Kitasatospora sp. A2-31 TaxID=2916414 RepID=UPI001EEC24AB|nr:DUF2752 domain-containing protein [Kitasatospora sp. A2-31]MCG6496334.1 DUF2752 domain-containing protein [Kitasatospora sp. A2-31]
MRPPRAARRPGHDGRGGFAVPARVRTALPPLAVAAGGLAGAAYLWSRNPHLPGQALPFCPWRKVTGLQCPGCGGTRLAYDLLHGDLAAAWHDNAALLLALPLVALLYLTWLRHGLAGRSWRPVLGRGGIAAVLGTAVAWTVLRNLAL